MVRRERAVAERSGHTAVAPPMALRHTVLIVTNPGGLEFHLDHRVDPRRGHHRVVDEAGLAAWIADAGRSAPVVPGRGGLPRVSVGGDVGAAGSLRSSGVEPIVRGRRSRRARADPSR